MLEADFNEAQEISTEELREEALDFVGPSGTPDDGYKVIFPADELSKSNFYLSQGSMYVGGLRVVQPNADFNYMDQADWRDRTAEISPSKNELVYLFLREQEVSAVEDSALREVALGGPDTAQRTRLVQHIERMNLLDSNTTGALALARATEVWSARGFIFEPSTMRLRSKGQLKAVCPTVPAPDSCAPAMPQGYLGDENQLIRVQVSAPGKIVWGYDNASFLYRATRQGYDAITNTTTLKLASIPVDERHRPRGGQAVEILRRAVKLDDDDTEHMAASSGQVTTVSQAYDTRTQTIVVNNDVGEDGASAVFVRVWEKELPLTSGAIVIGPHGLEVTLTTLDGGPFTVGDYWLIAVRPSEPSRLYPARLATPQPPDGPRRWACPLALISQGVGGQPIVLVDFREPFDSLVELTKRSCCECTFRVSPAHAELALDLQTLIDDFVSSVPYGTTSIVVCFDPGVYSLSAPLRLDDQHNGLTLDGGKGGVVFKAAFGHEDAFIDGLICMTNTKRVTLRGIELELPVVHFVDAGGTLASVSQEEFLAQGGEEFDFSGLLASMGVRLFGCTNTTIRGCTFSFPVSTIIDTHNVGAGIFAQGVCSGLTIEGNTFVRTSTNDLEKRILFGFLLVPSTTVVVFDEKVAEGRVLRPVLDQASLSDNTFSGITAAAMTCGDLGVVSIERNRVKDCYAGFWLMSLRTLVGFEDAEPTGDLGTHLDLLRNGTLPPPLASKLLLSWSDSNMRAGGAIARAYPIPSGAILTDGVTYTGPEFSLSDANKLHEVLRRVEASLVSDVKALVLRVANNDVDTSGFSESGGPTSAAAIAVWDLRLNPWADATSGSAIVSANRLVSSSGTSTAVLVAIEYCTVTGNLIHCRPGSTTDFSLIHLRGEEGVVAGASAPTIPPIAVTGNMLQGLSRLPTRGSALDPAGGWALFNFASPLTY